MSNSNPIQDRYATHLAEDLENNANEQEKVRAQLAELQGHLARLEQEQAWLTQMQRTMAVAPGAEVQQEPVEETPSAGEAAEPEVAPTAPPAPRTRGRKKPAGEPAARAARKSAAVPKTGRRGKAGGSRASSEPTVRSLVLDVLGETSEPRMVSEFVDALAKNHPNRAPSTAVVRNTLESLVAKGIAQRTRTEGSVFYTPGASSAVGGDGATAAPKVDEPVPEET